MVGLLIAEFEKFVDQLSEEEKASNPDVVDRLHAVLDALRSETLQFQE